MENELTSVVVNGQTTSFTYDANGIRVKTVQPNGGLIDTPFPDYEVEGPNQPAQTIRITLSIAGQTIAQRIITNSTSTYYYLFTDHLGSLIAMQDSSGGLTAGSRAYYYPFGDYRGTPPSQTLTDRGFTGQKSNNQPAGDLGLLYYTGRYYIPAIGKFASADTLVPDPSNPQQFNRYAYTLNNPLKFTDPSGHVCYDPGSDAATPGNCNGGSTLLPTTPHPPQVTHLWIDPEVVEAIQLYGNTNFAFELDENGPNYSYSQGFHGGLDLIAPAGTEVIAGINGRVVWIESGAYKPTYIVIEIAPEIYLVLGHLSGNTGVEVGQIITPDYVVGTVGDREDVDHLHVEFWTGPGATIWPRMIEAPYQFMSPEVEAQFLGLMAEMDEFDSRITFHSRPDGMWASIYAQPALSYSGNNLNVGQPNYVNSWPQ